MMLLAEQENVYEDVWQTLGPTKFLLGRAMIRRMTQKVLMRWNPEILAISRGQAYQDQVDAIAKKAARDTYGSIMIMLFIGLASAIVQVLLERWLLNDQNKTLLRKMREDLL